MHAFKSVTPAECHAFVVVVVFIHKLITLIQAVDPQSHVASVPLLIPPCPCCARYLMRYRCLPSTCVSLPMTIELVRG